MQLHLSSHVKSLNRKYISMKCITPTNNICGNKKKEDGGKMKFKTNDIVALTSVLSSVEVWMQFDEVYCLQKRTSQSLQAL